MIFNLPNPIPSEVKDKRDLNDFFKGKKLIPYYSTIESTSHSFLDLLVSLTSLSPTFRACAKDLCTYAFGREIKFVGKGQQENDEIAPELAQDIKDYLKGLNIYVKQFIDCSWKILHHVLISGNSYLYIKRIQVSGTVRYEMSVKHFKHCIYVESMDMGEDFILISKFIGNLEQMVLYPPKIIRATYVGEEIKWDDTDIDGVMHAIVHIKRDDFFDESEYYSRPDILGVLPYLYTDYQLGNLSSKIAATEIITKKILAFQAPDPNALTGEQLEDENGNIQELTSDGYIGRRNPQSIFQRNMLVLKELVTNLSIHPSLMGNANPAAAIGGVEYPYGGTPPVPIDLELNRDKEYQEWQSDRAISFICSSLQWSPELMSLRQTKTGLGGNLLYDIFVMKNEGTIIPIQIWFEGIWNWFLESVIVQENGPKEYLEIGVKFEDVVSEMLEKFSAGKSMRTIENQVSNTNPSQNEGNVDDPE